MYLFVNSRLYEICFLKRRSPFLYLLVGEGKGQKCSEELVLVAGTSFFFSCVSPGYTALCTLRTGTLQYCTYSTVYTGILLLAERNPYAQVEVITT